MENEILEALKTVRRVCKEHETCHDCPLRTKDNACSVYQCRPYEWKLLGDIEEETDRLFTNY